MCSHERLRNGYKNNLLYTIKIESTFFPLKQDLLLEAFTPTPIHLKLLSEDTGKDAVCFMKSLKSLL